MKTKHTPGPWIIEDDYVTDCDGNIVADVFKENQWNTTEGMVTEEMPWEANARLIAAAPELLYALQELFEGLVMEGVAYHRVMKKAKTLIDKLTDQ